MKRILGLAIAFAAILGASTLAVERFDDRELFVPPPDSVAEQFVRAVVNERYDQARAYLAEESFDLAALRAQLGDPSEVEAEIVSSDEERALVNVRVSPRVVTFSLAFGEEWKIVR